MREQYSFLIVMRDKTELRKAHIYRALINLVHEYAFYIRFAIITYC